MDRPTVVLISLGSNIEPEVHLPRAVARLAERCRVIAVSRVYRSAAAGAAGDPLDAPPFLNAAVALESGLGPLDLKLGLLRPLEAELGRVRTADRNAPRTIDLDIALFGDLIVSDERLQLPDPEIVERAYLAVPLSEVAPHAVHPVEGRTLAEIAARVPGRADLERVDLALEAGGDAG